MSGLTQIVIGLLLLGAVAWLLDLRRRQPERDPPTARRPVTKLEQSMYFRLQETFPDCVVLTQVSFSALLKSDSRNTRNTFNRKMAAFVLCTKAFEVVAVIGLDDPNYIGRERANLRHDKMLQAAKYKVLRFKRVPSSSELTHALGVIAATLIDSAPKRRRITDHASGGSARNQAMGGPNSMLTLQS